MVFMRVVRFFMVRAPHNTSDRSGASFASNSVRRRLRESRPPDSRWRLTLDGLENMSCECDQLPQILNLESYPNHVRKRLHEVDLKSEEWVKLLRCLVCGQHWQLDEWDKYQAVCAIKIADPENWRSYDDKPDRFRLLVEARGGLSDEECVKAGCQDKALRTLGYCPAHAYEVGLRE